MTLEESLRRSKENNEDIAPLVAMLKRKSAKGIIQESVEEIDRIVKNLDVAPAEKEKTNICEEIITLIAELEEAVNDYTPPSEKTFFAESYSGLSEKPKITLDQNLTLEELLEVK